ncbi:MAG: hypothetical protein D6705_17260 [Deltaproteobacteria bacterium]|nr:MAG: hypothetical protein D6705_17260 [Deltaproteobacteria bacterium]
MPGWSAELAGCFAAIGTILDPGASREGGWEYVFFHGVWPQALSVPFVLAYFSVLVGPIGRRPWRRVGLAAVFGALAILAHPFALPPLAAVTLALWLVALVRREGLGDLLVPPAGFVLATGAAAVWLSTFLGGAFALDRHPVPWHPLSVLVGDLLRGRLLDHGGIGFVAPAATIGLAWLALRGGRVGHGFVLAVLGLLVAASEDAIAVLRLDLVLPAIRNLQFPRFALYLAPFCAVAGGVAVAAVAAAVERASRSHRTQPATAGSARPAPKPLRAGSGVLLAAVLGGVFAGLWSTGPAWPMRPVGTVDTLEGDPLEEADETLRDRLDAFAAEHGRPPVVAFLRAGLSGATYPLLACADAGARVLLFGHVPTINRRVDLRRPSPALLDLLGVDFVVYDGPLPRRHPLAGTFDDVERVASLRIVRWRGGRAPARAGAGLVPARPTGSGTFDVEIPPGLRHATVPLSPHPAWRIERSGRLLEGTRDAIAGGAAFALGFDTTDGEGPVHLAFAPPRLPPGGGAWGLACWLAAFGLLVADRRLPVPRPSPRLAVTFATGFAALLVVAAAGAYVRARSQLARSWEDRTRPRIAHDGLRPPQDEDRPPPTGRFVADLVLRGAHQILSIPDDPCRALAGKDPRRGCRPRLERPRRSFLSHGGHLYRCLRVTIPAGGWVRLRLPVPESDRILALVRRVRGSAKRLRFRVPALHGATAHPLADALTPVRLATTNLEGAFFEVRFANRDRDPATVCIAAAAFDDLPAD